MGPHGRGGQWVSRARGYWPDAAPAERRASLIAVWGAIVAALEGEIAGAAGALALPDPAAPAATLKAFEDQLDAVVCAWVGVCVLEGRARALGDGDAAIWTPDPRSPPPPYGDRMPASPEPV